VAQRGKRVLLHVPLANDVAELLALNRASTKSHYGLVSPPKNENQFAAFLERFRTTENVGFLVCRIEDKRMVGSINLSQIFRGGF
jgi:RimJ/RimL family protein N-acetyltransferase